MKYITMALALFMMSVSPAKAHVERYEFDTVHSQIIFFVSHLGFSISEGEFLDWDGFIEFNHDEPAQSKVEVDIKTASIDMDDKKWDDHMKNEDFFNVEKYPSMTFKSTNIEVTGEKTAKITGDLTILETTKPVTLDVTFNNAGQHPFGNKYVAGWSATTSIKRSEFGMNYGLPNVGDDVEIRIEVEAVRQDGDKDEPKED